MRRKYIKGKYEDMNKYFTCPTCGFILNKEKHFRAERVSKKIVEMLPDNTPDYGAYGGNRIILDTLTNLDVVKRYEEEESVSVKNVTINVGCPFCGNVNI